MRRLVITAVLALSAITLVGCSAPGVSSVGSAPSVGAPDVAPGRDNSVAGAVGTTPSVQDRQVITTGRLTVTVEKPADAADDAVRIVEQSGGRIDARTEKPPVKGDKGSAQLTVRIPSAKLTATLDAIKKLGTVQDISIASQDVTAQSQDLDARIAALRTSVDRLVNLMSKAASTADLITIESALSERQGNLESLEAQKRALDGQVELATISLYLGSAADAPAETPNTFLTGLVAGWNGFVAVFASLVVVLGVLLPWIALTGIAAIAVLVIVRTRRKRSASASD